MEKSIDDETAKEIFRSISILTVTIIIALVGSLMGNWLIGSLGIVIAVLLIAGSIFQSN